MIAEKETGAKGCELLLLPFEQSTSYLKGAGDGPQSLGSMIDRTSFAKWAVLDSNGLSVEKYLEKIAGRVFETAMSKRKILSIGGEHTVTYGVLDGMVKAGIRPFVIQLDAHADLRDEYGDTPWSHACVMRRVIENLKLQTMAVGVRSLSTEEADYMNKNKLSVIYAYQLRRKDFLLDGYTAEIGKNVYLTIDMDFLDPSVAPGTGTPEPGGLRWYEALDIIDQLIKGKNLIGFDLVEYCPVAEKEVTGRAASELINYLCGFM